MKLERTLHLAADHPTAAGHFPQRPVMPGAVLLDAAIAAIEDACGRHVNRVAVAKFPSGLHPGVACRLVAESRADGSLRVTIRDDSQTYLSAVIETAAGSASTGSRR